MARIPMMILVRILLTIKFLMCSSAAFARFDQTDADLVDQEERLNGASFHDANTYRFYPRFDRLWLQKDIGYRISDGSFDADRSRIHEQLKVKTSTEDTVSFAYTRDYYHDLVDKLAFEEIRLAWKPFLGVYFAGLADGNTSYKQWGDLGAAIGWMRDRLSFIEFYRWSVDHFYNSKAEIDLGTYHGKPSTSGIKISWSEPQLFYARLNFEDDKKFRWFRFNCDCDYQYDWWRGDYQIQLFPVANVTTELKGNTAYKREKKSWGDSYSKEMEQKTNRHEASIVLENLDLSYYYLGYVRIQRQSDYEFDYSNIPSTFSFEEDASADAAHREVIAFLMYNLPMDDQGRYFFQTGYSQNWVTINRELSDEDVVGKTTEGKKSYKTEFADEETVEQKFQFAFELHLRENFWVFLNATLDVDGIRKEFPYRERPSPGNIWDGGGVQLMATF